MTIYETTTDKLAELFVYIRNHRYTKGQIEELVDRCEGLKEELEDKIPLNQKRTTTK